MEIERPRRIRQAKVKSDTQHHYSHALQFYSKPPTETISLQEFEEFAIERLKVLKAIETIGIRHLRGSDNYNEALEKEIKKTKFRSILKVSKEDVSEDEVQVRRLDHISHFILRLAYCRSEELRRWFLQQELDLFRYRFLRESAETSQTFMKLNNLNYTPIPEKEKDEVLDGLRNARPDKTAKTELTEFFKVPFTEALDLVRARKVFLQQGYAYVPRDDLISILLSVYRTHLSHALALTCRALPHLEEDDRLLPMLCGLSKRYLGQDYANRKSVVGEVTADMLDMLCKKSYPLCMQELHQSVRSNHHLRHGGRQQYGLFLKGIGLSLDEAMKFWRTEFTKLLDVDKFDKQYSYNIRHNYGKEGKRTNYTPYSCMKIIMSNPPGPGDAHGCPFRHCDSELLKQKLRSRGLSKDEVEQITNEAKGGHYQTACATFFDFTHRNMERQEHLFNHPNQYFDESQLLHNSGSTVKTPKVLTKCVRVSASQNHGQSQEVATGQSQVTSQMTGVEEMDDDFSMTAEEMDLALLNAEKPTTPQK
ncbi:DNA primase large subunit-like [Gigantopelta aegis]|uniref:DNA primase large subunit-like n=1 Tax=Gigantopelta aegis TaxID=1735272 RepID=UPI001B88B816|nr:DNA primase large subunit-like [Gigantopelta aegis]